jgi:hypothetical protein
MAELLRLRAGYAPADWVREGEGAAWDDHAEKGVTARFLDHVDKRHKGFVAALNTGLKQATSGVELFKKITGKDVKDLWAEYKKAAA